jgi:NAD-dependent SIR2 family protein deacetylase
MNDQRVEKLIEEHTKLTENMIVYATSGQVEKVSEIVQKRRKIREAVYSIIGTDRSEIITSEITISITEFLAEMSAVACESEVKHE